MNRAVEHTQDAGSWPEANVCYLGLTLSHVDRTREILTSMHCATKDQTSRERKWSSYLVFRLITGITQAAAIMLMMIATHFPAPDSGVRWAYLSLVAG